jgi:hypothetical protein
MKGPAPGAAEAIGALADLVSAFGVIVTLGYFAFQVRQSTRAVRAKSQRALFGHTLVAAARSVISFGRDFRIARLNYQGGIYSRGGSLFPRSRGRFR